MVIFRFGVIASLVGFVVTIVAVPLAGALAKEDSGWAGQPVHILASRTDSYSRYDGIRSCSGGNVQRIQVTGDKQLYRACVFGEIGGIRLGRYLSEQGLYAWAVSPLVDEKFYELVGICEGLEKCMYSAGGDKLMAQSYINSGLRGMSIYENFSKSLKLRIDQLTGSAYYEFLPNKAPFEVRIGDQIAAIESGVVSRNGRWAVVEVRSMGVLLIDTNTYRYRRVLAPGAEYGRGSDPAFELAISEDGRYLAMAGYRVGLSLLQIDDDCGDVPDINSNKHFEESVKTCSYANVDTYGLFPDIYSAHYPSFDDTGSRLNVMIQKRDGGIVRATLAPHGVMTEAVPYVAFGDSFSSGQGELEDSYYLPNTNAPPHVCHVSSRSYPHLIAQAWGVLARSVACSGAQTLDIIGGDLYIGQGGRLTELVGLELEAAYTDALETFIPGVVRQVQFARRYAPKVITLGIGGNDAGLMDKLTVCLGLTVCDWASNPEMRAASAKEIGQVYGRIRSVISELREASLGSSIVVVGYPEIISESSDAQCGVILDALLSPAERQFMGESIRYLNEVVSAAARSEGAHYVSVEDSFRGQRLCEGDGKAMNGIRYGDDIAPIGSISMLKLIGSESFHPTPFGHSLIANRILSTFSALSSEGTLGYVTESVEELAPTASDYWGLSGVSEEHGLRLVRAGADEVVRKPGSRIDWAIKPGIFLPNSTIKIGISPGGTELTGAVSYNDEFIAVTAVLPKDMPDGYYALHAYGTDASGREIDYYKVFAVGVEEDDLKEKSVFTGIVEHADLSFVAPALATREGEGSKVLGAHAMAGPDEFTLRAKGVANRPPIVNDRMLNAQSALANVSSWVSVIVAACVISIAVYIFLNRSPKV